MARKNILYVESSSDGTVGGSHFCLLDIIKRLDRTAYNPTVVFYNDNMLVPEFREAGCKVIILKKRRALNLLSRRSKDARDSLSGLASGPLLVIQKALNYMITFILPALSSWKVIVRERADLVHLNNTLVLSEHWILASLFTKARIIAHERGINTFFPPLTRSWGRFLRAVICISGAVLANLKKHGFPQTQLRMIYDGLDPYAFSARVSRGRQEVLSEFGIGPGSLVIGIIGNIKEWKGQKTVILAMKTVLKKYPDARCLIIGGLSDRASDSAYYESLLRTVREEGLGSSVVFTGQRSDVASIVNALDLVVHASIEPEPFGRVNLEGMALSKPVISTTLGAGPEIIVHGLTGYTVPPGEPEPLAQSILSLLGSPEQAARMGRAGRERLMEKFHISGNIRGIEAIYREVLA
ncbi:MAG: glycosyltransferase family 4 protein [Thermodesulfobacteriota bacterium]|nr:MAG: glycosyltransferase family 4 protein [Thermodesulfobacteriota bacterium]